MEEEHGGAANAGLVKGIMVLGLDICPNYEQREQEEMREKRDLVENSDFSHSGEGQGTA